MQNGTKPMGGYLENIWNSRHFWTHLAMADLRSRWKRSFFGMLWSILQPLGLTVLLAIVFGRIFKIEMAAYAPYILSGVIVWDFITSTAMGGSLAFVQADAYIKQFRHPLAIYTLRTVLANLIVLLTASVGLIGWVLIALPNTFAPCWLAALLIFPIVGLIAWPMATALAYIGSRFRDIPHALGLLLQAVWFVSPIYFDAQLLRNSGLHALVDYNPLYHLLQIVRAPLLQGEWPSTTNFAYCAATLAVMSLLAWQIGRRVEESVIFYL
jgi:lipopolysaccharide transport system permease protein